jgi:hypothetical protein
MSLNCGDRRAYCSFTWWWRGTVEWYQQVKVEKLKRKLVPVSLCPPQIPHWLKRARTRTTVVWGQWLTAWAMTRFNAYTYCRCWSRFPSLSPGTSCVQEYKMDVGYGWMWSTLALYAFFITVDIIDLSTIWLQILEDLLCITPAV